MGASVLHIKSEVECRVYLFDEEVGIAHPGKYFNLEVRKGEQDLLFVSTEDDDLRYHLLYPVEENDCDYRLTVEEFDFDDDPEKTSEPQKIIKLAIPTDEEIERGEADRFGVIYSDDGAELLSGYFCMVNKYRVRYYSDIIRSNAFADCKNIEEITLPDGLTHIGDNAFSGCVNLAKITTPLDLVYIGDYAFMGCAELTSIDLSASTTHIGNGAFLGCDKLTCINIPEGTLEQFKKLLPKELHSKLIEEEEF